MNRPKRTTISSLNLSRRGVPKRLHNSSIDDFKDYGNDSLREVREFIRDYIDNIHLKFKNNTGLFLYGSNGVGKSMLASIIVKEAYINRYSSKRVTFVDYVSEYTRVWNTKSIEERENAEAMFYHEYKAVEFLVLEELGKELDSKLTPTVLEDCLRYREERGLPTIICTNLTPKAIVDKYGSSIESLIKGNFVPIKIVGLDKRAEYFEGRT